MNIHLLTLVVVDPLIQVPFAVLMIGDLTEGLPRAEQVVDAAVAVDDVDHVGQSSSNAE